MKNLIVLCLALFTSNLLAESNELDIVKKYRQDMSNLDFKVNFDSFTITNESQSRTELEHISGRTLIYFFDVLEEGDFAFTWLSTKVCSSEKTFGTFRINNQKIKAHLSCKIFGEDGINMFIGYPETSEGRAFIQNAALTNDIIWFQSHDVSVPFDTHGFEKALSLATEKAL